MREDEVDEEEENEEEDEDDMSASYSISDVCGTHVDVEIADTELDKDVSEVELRSVDLQSSFEPELQQISSTEPQQVPLTSQTEQIEAQPPSGQLLSASLQVLCIHCRI